MGSSPSSRILFQQHRDEVHTLRSGPDCVAEAAGHNRPLAEVTPLLGTWPRVDIQQLAFLKTALERGSWDTGAAGKSAGKTWCMNVTSTGGQGLCFQKTLPPCPEAHQVDLCLALKIPLLLWHVLHPEPPSWSHDAWKPEPGAPRAGFGGSALGFEVFPLTSSRPNPQRSVLSAESEHRKHCGRSFPGGSVGTEPPAEAGDAGLIPGLGRSHVLQGK